jgi:membrane protease YdiL (CAAX protease family)
MPDWATFAAFAGVVASALLLLSHASRGVVSEVERPHRPPEATDSGLSETNRRARGGDEDAASGEDRPFDDPPASDSPSDEPAGRDGARDFVATPRLRYGPEPPTGPSPSPSTTLLLVNVAVSQGLFAVFLLAGALYADVPATAFGAGVDAFSPRLVLVGVGLGLALYVANELGAAAGERFGLGGGDELREALAPESPLGWAVLLFLVLPVIAGFEELLFRGALIGAFVAGFDVSPWAMAVVSSVAFALGHGAQGRLGIVVTGALGFVLATAFVLTGSLVVVVVAHYLVNALEFVVHEGFAERPS